MTNVTLAIVGAGMAGLACATRLAATGVAVTLFDKAREPGGRMSTRRMETGLGEVAFDHGAQYFHRARPALRRTGTCLGGARGGRTLACGGIRRMGRGASDERSCEADGRHLQGALVNAHGRHEDRSQLRGPATPQESFDAVVVAVPAEQAGPLLRNFDPRIAARADVATAAPCWTVMAVFEDPVPSGDVVRGQGMLGWAARNSAKPGRDAGEAWVLQATPEWSQRHLEDTADGVTQSLLAAFAVDIGRDLPKPAATAVNRWRYARYGRAAGEGVPWNEELGLGVCGDWLLGPRVECAWLPGIRLAEAIARDRG